MLPLQRLRESLLAVGHRGHREPVGLEVRAWRELAGATAFASAAALGAAGWKGLVALAVTAALTAGHGLACRRRIGGVTGDTLGAAIQTSEALILVVGVALR